MSDADRSRGEASRLPATGAAGRPLGVEYAFGLGQREVRVRWGECRVAGQARKVVDPAFVYDKELLGAGRPHLQLGDWDGAEQWRRGFGEGTSFAYAGRRLLWARARSPFAPSIDSLLLLSALRSWRSYLRRGFDRVIDYGCGSGVLAWGFGLLVGVPLEVVLVDVDPPSRELAEQNLRRNWPDLELTATTPSSVRGDARAGLHGRTLILANLPYAEPADASGKDARKVAAAVHDGALSELATLARWTRARVALVVGGRFGADADALAAQGFRGCRVIRETVLNAAWNVPGLDVPSGAHVRGVKWVRSAEEVRTFGAGRPWQGEAWVRRLAQDRGTFVQRLRLALLEFRGRGSTP